MTPSWNAQEIAKLQKRLGKLEDAIKEILAHPVCRVRWVCGEGHDSHVLPCTCKDSYWLRS